jgi:hypothetical protein
MILFTLASTVRASQCRSADGNQATAAFAGRRMKIVHACEIRYISRGAIFW